MQHSVHRGALHLIDCIRIACAGEAPGGQIAAVEHAALVRAGLAGAAVHVDAVQALLSVQRLAGQLGGAALL